MFLSIIAAAYNITLNKRVYISISESEISIFTTIFNIERVIKRQEIKLLRDEGKKFRIQIASGKELEVIMATWGIHIMVVDRLFELGLDLDERAFCVGNIAPDCNIENEDWTSFIPSREVTHWMNGKSKLTADYEGFFKAYLSEASDMNFEKLSFMLGYYSHLIVDVEFQKFVREENRVQAIFRRLFERPDLSKQIGELTHNFDTIKSVFGKNKVFYDINQQEKNYLVDHPECRYNSILRKIDTFPDYIDYLPAGAIVRKLKTITNYLDTEEQRTDFLFFSEDEISDFIEAVCQFILVKITGEHLIKACSRI